MYKRLAQGWVKHLDFILLDCLCLLFSCVAATELHIRFDGDTLILDRRLLTITFVVVDFAGCVVFNIMNDILKRSARQELIASLRHAIAVMAVMLLVHVVNRAASEKLSFMFLLSLTFLYTGLNWAVRTGWKRVVRVGLKRYARKRKVLIVVREVNARQIVEHLSNSSYTLAGLVLTDRNAKGERCGDIPVVANVADTADYLCREWIDEVFFFTAALNDEIRTLMDQCRDMALTVHLYVAIQGVEPENQIVERISGYEFLTSNIIMISGASAAAKWLFDMAVGLAGSAIALLVMAIFGPIIQAQSPGPVLYKQERIGRNGQKFKMYKLRSMDVNADAQKASLGQGNSHEDGMMFKMDFDPRVVGNRVLPDGTLKRGVGDFVRRGFLDEFPQFFNVLRGEMSVVGTRPPTVDEWEKYKYSHRARMSVKPGLTGLWQIQQDKDEMDFERVVELDTAYIKNWSMGRDMLIILKTFQRMLVNGLGKGKQSPSKKE